MFGIKELPCRGDLTSKADTTAPYVSIALKAVPLLAPEYGDATMQQKISFIRFSINGFERQRPP